jgi:hypothetical protein
LEVIAVQKVILAVSTTVLLSLGALLLIRPELRLSVSLIQLVASIGMFGSGLIGVSRIQNRRLPTPWTGLRTTPLGWLHLAALVGSLLSLGLGVALPTRFKPEGMGWSMLGLGFVGYAWLLNQLRLERYGVMRDSGRKD